ncbi:hypothetical protein BH11MYX4_BH11MYX4_32020 [soil metagenome]
MLDDDGDATIMEGAVRRSGHVAPVAVFRSRMMDPVPAVYDAADDGDDPQATALMEPGTALMESPVKLAAPAPYRNVGATMVMPATASIEMRDAIMASLRHVQPPPYPAQASYARPRPQPQPPAPASPAARHEGISRFEIAFAASAAVMVGLTAALLFVYFG